MPTDGIGHAEWLLNNQSIGKGKEGVDRLKKFEWPKDAVVELRVPKECDLSNPKFTSPHYCMGLIQKFRGLKLNVKYFWGDKELKVHTLTWTTDREPIFLYDDVVLGASDQAYAKLMKMSGEKGGYVQVIIPGVVGGGTSTLAEVPLKDDNFIAKWRNVGAWVELIYERIR